VRFSHLIIHFPHIKEIDINPFFVSGDDSFVLDANILLEADVLDGFVPIKGDFCPPHLSICPYPDQYIDILKLREGPAVIIRPIRPEDEPLVEELLKTSSEQTLTMRFFGKISEMSHDQLTRYCHVDYDREMSFVAVMRKNGETERVIGEVRMSKLPDLENAEMAIVVGDQWQGQGIGKALCQHCIKTAKESGIKKMWMEILQANSKMLLTAEKMGFRRVSSDGDSAKVLLEL
jgi:acetyltransferase